MVTGLLLTQAPNFGFLHTVEQGLGNLAGLLKVFLELVSILIIFYAALITLQVYLRYCRSRQFCEIQRQMRLDLGRYLSLSLEFLLAADIVGTAVSPSWEAIGKLAAISGIRTFLNYFLEQEVKELETD